MNIFKSFFKKIFRPIYNFYFKLLKLSNLKYLDNLFTLNNTPFLNDKFLEIYNKSVENTIKKTIDPKFYFRMHQLIWAFETIKSQKKNFSIVELGTGKGLMMYGLSQVIKKNPKRNTKIFMFDTFLPYKTNKTTGEQKIGSKESPFYSDSYEQVKETFKRFNFVNIKKGKCPQILFDNIKDFQSMPIGVLHVDMNYHKAEIDSIDFLYKFFAEVCIIVLDDYANLGRDEQAFFHEKYFKSKNLSILTTASGQGIVICIK